MRLRRALPASHNLNQLAAATNGIFGVANVLTVMRQDPEPPGFVGVSLVAVVADSATAGQISSWNATVDAHVPVPTITEQLVTAIGNAITTNTADIAEADSIIATANATLNATPAQAIKALAQHSKRQAKLLNNLGRHILGLLDQVEN